MSSSCPSALTAQRVRDALPPSCGHGAGHAISTLAFGGPARSRSRRRTPYYRVFPGVAACQGRVRPSAGQRPTGASRAPVPRARPNSVSAAVPTVTPVTVLDTAGTGSTAHRRPGVRASTPIIIIPPADRGDQRQGKSTIERCLTATGRPGALSTAPNRLGSTTAIFHRQRDGGAGEGVGARAHVIQLCFLAALAVRRDSLVVMRTDSSVHRDARQATKANARGGQQPSKPPRSQRGTRTAVRHAGGTHSGTSLSLIGRRSVVADRPRRSCVGRLNPRRGTRGLVLNNENVYAIPARLTDISDTAGAKGYGFLLPMGVSDTYRPTVLSCGSRSRRR